MTVTRSENPPGVPTARRVDHVGMTVSDLDAAVDLLVAGLGGELVYSLPTLSHSDDWMAVHLDVHPRASARIALVRLGPVTNVELFQYQAPDQVSVPPRPHEVGSHHLGLYVDDVDKAAAHLLRRLDVHPAGPAYTEPADSPRAGVRWIRMITPWGLSFEVRSVPPEARAGDGRFGPCPSWTNRDDGSPATAVVPGLRNVDHLAYTVADLPATIRFFTEVLGAELLYRAPATRLEDGDLAAALGVPARGTMTHAALRLGPTDNVDLYQYDVAGAASRPPRNSDVGGRHLALYVDDVDAAVAYLRRQRGVTVLGDPETIPDGPIAGDRWAYVRTPTGPYLEVVNMPDGRLPYERETAARRRPSTGLRWTTR
ncbi:VOC family protein [Micromonospora sp. NPDC048898]|uniref:VOC family protein n=1 Tax=Micromonospora sp. NPDC048898 TaxID=3364260 RepID=UPI003724A618